MSNNKDSKFSETDDERGSGGQSGTVEFRDFLAVGNEKTPPISPEEIKHSLAVHKDKHSNEVAAQKRKREDYKELREGKRARTGYEVGNRNMRGAYKEHMLSKYAQFAGTDNQVNLLPNEQADQEANKELREEMQHRYELRYSPQFAPKHTIKPSPFK